jgi:hypothetical protein
VSGASPDPGKVTASRKAPADAARLRRQRLRIGWALAGIVWGLLAAAVALLYVVGEGFTLSLGPFRFHRGTNAELTRDLIMIFSVVIFSHLAGLCLWSLTNRRRPAGMKRSVPSR